MNYYILRRITRYVTRVHHIQMVKLCLFEIDFVLTFHVILTPSQVHVYSDEWQNVNFNVKCSVYVYIASNNIYA